MILAKARSPERAFCFSWGDTTIRSVLASFLAIIAASMLASCTTSKPGPEVTVTITVEPTETGLAVAYGLPAGATRFPFEGGAGDIRTDGWTTASPGATILESAVTFPAPVTAFEVAMAPDKRQRDRIYPALTPIGEGWLIHTPHLLPANVGGLAHDVKFTLPDGWTIVGHRGRDDELSLDGWVFIGPESYVERGATDVVTSPDTPAWLRAEILKAANDSAALYASRLGVALRSKPGIVIGHFPKDRGEGMRGDVTSGAMVSVRFYGDGWRDASPRAADQVREFLAHETFHFWNGDMVDSAENAQRPWLHEGGASYAAILALEPKPAPDSAPLLAGINENLARCQSALKEDQNLMTADLRGGEAPYACGVVLQWAWDAGLRATSRNERDVLSLWKDVIADALRNGREYSVDGATRRVPRDAAKAGDVLLNRTGADRWTTFADAARGYGAVLESARSVGEDRAAALMHVLSLHCTGQRGFSTMEAHIEFDTGDRCGPLNGDKAFDAVAGHDALKDASAMYDSIRNICAAGGKVDFTRKGVVTASAPCTEPLRAPILFLRVTRAFAAP